MSSAARTHVLSVGVPSGKAQRDEKLSLARGDTPAGTVGELQQKHLLALNLRGVVGADTFVPRSYYLPSEGDRRSACSERAAFTADLMLSQVVAIVQSAATCGVHSDEEAATAQLACTLCQEFVDRGSAVVGEEHWSALARFDLDRVPGQEHAESTEVLKQLRECAPELQLGLLRQNLWILKPSTGALGRGVSLLRGDWATPLAPGKERRADDGLGHVAQKYVERPHLIDPAWPAEGPKALHKYNVRLWVDVLWSAQHAEAWLYDEGYVEFARRPYTEDPTVQTAHVTNLSEPSAGESVPWLWPTEKYERYMLQCGERPKLEMKRVAELALGAVCPREEPKVRWKRFGLDFLIDEELHVWLLEFNHNPGMAAARGRRGDMKRALVTRFCRDEQRLREWRAGDVGGDDRLCEAVFGFVKLRVTPWQCRPKA